MTLNGEMAIILRYFTEFDNGPYFALFHRIRVRCRRITIVRLAAYPSRFQNLLLIVLLFMTILMPSVQLFSDYSGKTNSQNSV